VSAAPPLVACRDVTVLFPHGRESVRALCEVDLAVDRGETLALTGRSGSGKTTLLHVLGGLVAPTAGRVEWQGGPRPTVDELLRDDRPALRVGQVFQGGNLLEHLTAFENVAFAAGAAGEPAEEEAVLALLEAVGVAGKADSLPAELSGGEGQRVAVARALAQRPELLLCDEPTGQLDSVTGVQVLDLIDELQRDNGFALCVATHDTDVAARYGRAVELSDGRLDRAAAPA
jgi:ABC-type lipoprotein export system ATPase subunit